MLDKNYESQHRQFGLTDGLRKGEFLGLTMVPEEGQIPANGRKMIPNMIHNVNTTRNSAYNYSITYEKPQSKLKDMGGSKVLTETNDADNDVYRNAATKATMIAKVDRYSQGTFDVSLLIGGNNANSYFTFSIHFETGGKAEVSGLDEAQKEQVENYIESHWEQFKNVYLTSSDECTEMTDQEYRIAGYMEECNRFLSNASGGKVSVDDLSIERKVTGWYINSENIVGLPLVIASALNSADSTDKYHDYKQMIHSILNYKQQNGEIPQYHMDFKWSGKELQC